jgi:hypothetical protein
MTRAAAVALLLTSFASAGLLLRSCRHLRYSPLYHPDVTQLQVRESRAAASVHYSVQPVLRLGHVRMLSFVRSAIRGAPAR